MMPPAPTRMVFVPAAICASTTEVAALAIPAMRVLEGLALGRHLEDPGPTNLFQNVQAGMLFVFAGFAFLLHAVLNDLSKK